MQWRVESLRPLLISAGRRVGVLSLPLILLGRDPPQAPLNPIRFSYESNWIQLSSCWSLAPPSCFLSTLRKPADFEGVYVRKIPK